MTMFDSKREAANLLNEETEARSIRERLKQKQQQAREQQPRKKRNRDWER